MGPGPPRHAPDRDPATSSSRSAASRSAASRLATSLPLALVWRDRFHRSALLALFFAGLATSVAMPQLTTFFVTDLGATLPEAGLYYLTNVTAPVVGFALGRLSDRQADRLTLFRVGAVVGAVGWLAMGLSTQLWMPFVVSVLALGVAGAAGAQVYAAVRDELSRRPSPGDAEVISTVRMGFTLGWVVGPVLGSAVGAAFGLRAVLFVTATLAALQLVPMIGVRAPRFVRAAASPDEQPAAPPSRRASRRALLPLLAFCGLAVVASCGDTVKFAYLPLYMSEQLHLPALTRGAVIGLQPVCELLLMPLAAAMASRHGAMKVVMVGILCSVLAHLAYATSTSVVGLVAAQVLLSAMWAALAGLGVTVAQDLYPEGVGLASSTFMSSIVFASTDGGLVGSVFVSGLGIPHVFVVPAVLSVLALAGMAVLARRTGRRSAPAAVEKVTATASP